MEAKYSLVIYPTGPSAGKYWAQVLPFGNYRFTERVAQVDTRSCVFDTTGLVYRLFTVDEGNNEQPLSAIYFWVKIGVRFFGEVLSTGAKVTAKAYPNLDNLAIDGANLDITISDTLFKDAGDVEGKDDVFEPWSVAQRLKGLKTHPYSLYNNHNFYTITDNENE